jgi:hypothetical protein
MRDEEECATDEQGMSNNEVNSIILYSAGLCKEKGRVLGQTSLLDIPCSSVGYSSSISLKF